jgi:hypothetical protein
MNLNPRLLVSTAVVEYMRLYAWMRFREACYAIIVPPLDPTALPEKKFERWEVQKNRISRERYQKALFLENKISLHLNL